MRARHQMLRALAAVVQNKLETKALAVRKKERRTCRGPLEDLGIKVARGRHLYQWTGWLARISHTPRWSSATANSQREIRHEAGRSAVRFMERVLSNLLSQPARRHLQLVRSSSGQRTLIGRLTRRCRTSLWLSPRTYTNVPSLPSPSSVSSISWSFTKITSALAVVMYG